MKFQFWYDRSLRSRAIVFGLKPADWNWLTNRAIQDFVRDRVVFVPKTKIQSKVRSDLELVLDVAHIEGPAQSVNALGRVVADGVQVVANEAGEGCKRSRRIVDSVARVVQADSSNIDPRLERMTSESHRHVVDVRESRPDLFVQSIRD